jgi:hypothetical protein
MMIRTDLNVASRVGRFVAGLPALEVCWTANGDAIARPDNLRRRRCRGSANIDQLLQGEVRRCDPLNTKKLKAEVSLKEYKSDQAFPRVIGRTFDVPQPA